MFDCEEFIALCRAALTDPSPRLAIQDLLKRTMGRPDDVARALPLERPEIVPLHASDELSVLKVVWAPGMSFRPHNHLMWAAIGLYGGQEDNALYRLDAGRPVLSGRLELTTGDVALLGSDAIHAVCNPRLTLAGAIHVYGGDITRREGRSEWEEVTLTEVPYDFERARAYFASRTADPSSPASGAS
jgi:predicted metal-dependent enzyme (double-stranded beta helix superfamily)